MFASVKPRYQSAVARIARSSALTFNADSAARCSTVAMGSAGASARVMRAAMSASVCASIA